MELNKVFLALQPGQGRCLRFMIAIGVSHDSYSKGSELFCHCTVRVTGGSWDSIYACQKPLRSQRVNQN
jgi:hypothetical protein